MLIELEALWQFIDKGLVQTGGQQSAKSGLCHDRLMEASTTAAIVAGGQARRFGGRDKSRLVVEGRSIIVRQLEVLQQVAGCIYVVGGPQGRFSDLGLRTVPDAIPGAGALGAIYTALVAAPSDAVLVLACDIPFLHAGLLHRLVELSTGRDGAWISGQRGIEPLLACYRQVATDRIRARLHAGLFKATDVAHVLDMGSVTSAELAAFGSEDRLLTNLNTPDDYARVQ
jgi:molybdopterin-guanine dinucleotide biosynthesis protein A